MRMFGAALMALAIAAGPAAPQLSPGFDQQGSEIETRDLDDIGETTSDVAPPPDIGRSANLAEGAGARLRGLDTLTNTVHDFDIGVGETLRFRRLIVSLDACRYPAGNVAAEAFAFLKIRDVREDDWRFSGWMLASSPALSALDHPRYDVWVLNCNTS